MSLPTESVEITLLNKKFSFKCQADKQDEFQEAALCLQQTIDSIVHKHPRLHFDEIITIAALTLSHERVSDRRQLRQMDYVRKHLVRVKEKLAEALHTI